MKVMVDNIIDDLLQGVAKKVMNITSDLSDSDKSRIYVTGPLKTGKSAHKRLFSDDKSKNYAYSLNIIH